MVDELKWLPKDRIKADQLKQDRLPVEMPKLPDVNIRREPGIFGKENALDRQHRENLLQTRRRVIEIDYIGKGQAVIGVSGIANATKAVEMMETINLGLEPGSLARELGEKLTEIHAQLLAQGQVALSKHYLEDAISRVTNKRG